jgi:hypothetical protein
VLANAVVAGAAKTAAIGDTAGSDRWRARRDALNAREVGGLGSGKVRVGEQIECFASERWLAARIVAGGAVPTIAPSIFGDEFAGMPSTGWDRHASVKEVIGQGAFLSVPDFRKLHATLFTVRAKDGAMSIINITIYLAIDSGFIVSLPHEGNIASEHPSTRRGRARS